MFGLSRLWLFGGLFFAALSVGYAVYSNGYSAGEAAVRAEVEEQRRQLQTELDGLADQLTITAKELATARAELKARANLLEDAARADPDAINRVPSADSLQRLEQRWAE